MHSNLTLAMIAKMVIITFGNFDRYSDYKINRGKFEYSILAQGNNLKMLNNRIPSRTSLISTKTGKLDKPLQHLFIISPIRIRVQVIIITAPLNPPLPIPLYEPKDCLAMELGPCFMYLDKQTQVSKLPTTNV